MKLKILFTLSIVSCLLICSSLRLFAKPYASSKLDHRLRNAAGITETFETKSVQPLNHHPGKGILVSIRLHVEAENVLEDLAQVGLDVIAHAGGLVSGFIPSESLLDLAGLSIVSTISPVPPPVNFAYEGEEVKSLRADLVRNLDGVRYDGSGVKVGVISNSFAYFSENNPTYINQGTEDNPDYVVVEPDDIDGDGIPDLTGTDSQLSGDLPEVIQLVRDALPFIFNGQDYSSLAYDDEGRALAEVVYDIAPGVEIAYYGATAGNADFVKAIKELAEIGCNVIVDDYFSQGSAIYQDDEISKTVKELAEEEDIVFVVAAGNFGAASVEAAYLDSNSDASDSADSDIPQGNDLHNWNITLSQPFPDPYLDLTMPPGQSANLFLYWENPFSGTLGPGATTDYDMYVLSEPEIREDTILFKSDNVQGEPGAPAGDPFESITAVNSATDEIKTLYIAVNLKKGPGANLKLIMSTNPRHGVTLQRDVNSLNSMLIGHPLSSHSLAIGAVNFVENDTAGTSYANPRQINPTYYSSHGGKVPILFSDSGERLDEPEYRFKPDITSIDGMNTSFFEGSGGDYGFDDDNRPNFLGTSAASPSAAGVIALMRQANPSLSASEIRRIAKIAATDIHEPGYDFFTGWGLLYADRAVELALDPPPLDSSIEDWMIFNPGK